MISTVINLDLWEPLELDSSVLRIVRVSGNRVRIEVRHGEGVRVHKPRTDRVSEALKAAGLSTHDLGENGGA